MSIVLINGVPTDVGCGADEIIQLRAENDRLRAEFAEQANLLETLKLAHEYIGSVVYPTQLRLDLEAMIERIEEPK